MTPEQLTRQVRALQKYVAVLTVILIICLIDIVLAQRRNASSVTELTAQRINIVEPDGRLDLVISNAVRQHPGRMNGKDFKPRPRSAGLIYFNEEGDECGGYVWDGTSKENGMTLTADQYKNDQIMALYYQQDSGAKPSRTYGFRLWDRSDSFTLQKELDYVDSLQNLHDTATLRKGIDTLVKHGLTGIDRLFLGRTRDGNTGLFIRDDKGVPRLRIYVDKQNKPVIETLDEKGEVLSSGPLDKR